MDIIGRAREREALMRCEASDKSELVCVYGPLQAGKTYLVSKTLSPYIAFHVVGLKQATTRDQLRRFGCELSKCGDSNPEPPKTWREAFGRMYKVVSAVDAPKSPHGKVVIFIDEFPWFCKQRSDFLSAFAQFWNRWSMVGQSLLVVVCGSDTSWMDENILWNCDDLAARVTESIYVETLAATDSESVSTAVILNGAGRR